MNFEFDRKIRIDVIPNSWQEVNAHPRRRHGPRNQSGFAD
jgi:hypothetical protein